MRPLSFLCALALLAGCDADPATTVTPEPSRPAPSGLSAIDGRPIVQVNAADFGDDTFGRALRGALVDRGDALLPALAAKRSGADDAVLLRDALAGAPSKTGTDAPSSHIVITDGDHQEFLLTLEHPTSSAAKSGVDTYVVLDPEVFHPDPDPDGESPVRIFPGTNLATGEEVEIVASADGVVADGAPVEDVLLVGVVPIIDPDMPGGIPPPPCDWDDPHTDCTGGTGGGGNGSGDDDDDGGDGGSGTPTFDYYSPHPYLGLRQLRVDESHDDGKFLWSDKQEVHLTSASGDNYATPFPQRNTRRFRPGVLDQPRRLGDDPHRRKPSVSGGPHSRRPVDLQPAPV